MSPATGHLRADALGYGRAMGPASAVRHRWRLSRGDIGRGLLGLVGATLGLAIASVVLPGFDVAGWEQALVIAVLVTVCGAVLRVPLVEGAVRLGWVGTILLGLLGQALILWLVAYAPYGGTAADLGWALLTSWIVAEAITKLSPEHRGVLLECYYRGASVAEASRRLGVPKGTVKSRCHYALRALALALEEMGVRP